MNKLLEQKLKDQILLTQYFKNKESHKKQQEIVKLRLLIEKY